MGRCVLAEDDCGGSLGRDLDGSGDVGYSVEDTGNDMRSLTKVNQLVGEVGPVGGTSHCHGVRWARKLAGGRHRLRSEQRSVRESLLERV